MPAYVVFTRTETIDQKELEIYWSQIRETFGGHSVEVLAAYGPHEVLEGEPIEGAVIAKFPSAEAAKAWYNSLAYQAAAKHRYLGAICNGFIVDGVSDTTH
jgi:uncharacterized protein (DUF1330 family)